MLNRSRAGFRNLTLREQEIQVRFNITSSCLHTRVKVECAFGILKGRWCMLSFIEEASVARVSKIIVACAVLHNLLKSAQEIGVGHT